MKEKHEAILELLLDERVKNPDLTFSLRKTNRYQRLEKGYWFHGNEHYLVVSFWTGMDWRNKTPNIFFTVNPEGETSLDMVSADKDGKWVFLKKIIDDTELEGLDSSDKSLHKDYPDNGNDFIASLESFLSGDKQIIDEFVKENSNSFFTAKTEGDPIGFIKKEEFENRLEKTEGYRIAIESYLEKGPTIWLDNLKIRGYGAIKELDLADLPSSANWIFLTGLNGVGKTSVLRSITLAALGNKTESDVHIDNETISITARFRSNHGEFDKDIQLSSKVRQDEVNHPGFAAYGASRLVIENAGAGNSQIAIADLFDEQRAKWYQVKKQTHYSIFNHDGILRNITELTHKIISNLNDGNRLDRKEQDKVDVIIEILTSVIHRLNRIEYPELTTMGLWEEIIFYEEDENEIPFETGASFFELASGMKSLIGMVGDMLIRMFEQQPSIEDPSEFIGTILIDEIDIHLHPILQRKLVEELSASFPKIQFIVSTHSPIPLLGAPEGSVILNVKRSAEEGIHVTRLKKLEKDLKHLLPNTILSSDIFDFGLYDGMNEEQFEELHLEGSYDEVEKMKEIDERLNSLDSSIFPDNLFDSEDGTSK